jgi:N-acetylmuramoyl-L-alanine amidase
MPKKHTIREGDSISSLSERFGLIEDTIWLHADNTELRQLRPNKNILSPGDVVIIPDKEKRQESCASDAKHQFKRKGVPALFKVQLFHMNMPRANQDYTLDIDGTLREGKTDANGVLKESISPNAKKARLFVGPDNEQLEFIFGTLEPLEETRGIAQRLSNIGLYEGNLNVEANDPALMNALSKFQAQQELPISGEIDDATLDKLKSVHDVQ